MDTLNKIKAILKQRLSLSDKAYLFGSRARGTSNSNSDWDILIILGKSRIEDSDYNEISYPLTELGWEENEVINPILYTLKDWQKQYFTPFFKNVEHDKILLS